MSEATVNHLNFGFVSGEFERFVANNHAGKNYYSVVLKVGATSFSGKSYDRLVEVSVPETTLSPEILGSLTAGAKVFIQYELFAGKDGKFTKPSATKFDFMAAEAGGSPF